MAPAQAFCSLTMLQELPGWMQFIVGATLKMFKALTQYFCVKCQVHVSRCNDSKKKWELRCKLSESLKILSSLMLLYTTGGGGEEYSLNTKLGSFNF